MLKNFILKTNSIYKRLLSDLKENKFEDWFFEFKNGHPILIKEESDIICKIRFNERFSHLNDFSIKKIIRSEIEIMYKNKFPKAKKMDFSCLNKYERKNERN